MAQSNLLIVLVNDENHFTSFKNTHGHSMDLITWPTTDCFFLKGVQSLMIEEGINYLQSTNSHVIVDFKISTLQKNYQPNWPLSFPGKKIIIISDKYMLPLANYLSKNFECITAVLEKETAIEALKKYFRHDLKNENRNRKCLSVREFSSLVFFLKEYSIHEQAKIMGVNIKTAYAFRKSAAMKMRLKRLIDIFRSP